MCSRSSLHFVVGLLAVTASAKSTLNSIEKQVLELEQIFEGELEKKTGSADTLLANEMTQFKYDKVQAIYAMNGDSGNICDTSSPQILSCPSVFDVAILVSDERSIQNHANTYTRFSPPVDDNNAPIHPNERVGIGKNLKKTANGYESYEKVEAMDNCYLEYDKLAKFSGGSTPDLTSVTVSPVGLQELHDIAEQGAGAAGTTRLGIASWWAGVGSTLIDTVNVSPLGSFLVAAGGHVIDELARREDVATDTDMWNNVSQNFDALQEDLEAVQTQMLLAVETRAREVTEQMTIYTDNADMVHQIETILLTKRGILAQLTDRWMLVLRTAAAMREAGLDDDDSKMQWQALLNSAWHAMYAAFTSLTLKGTNFENDPFVLSETLFVFKNATVLSNGIANEMIAHLIKKTASGSTSAKRAAWMGVWVFATQYKSFLAHSVNYLDQAIPLAINGFDEGAFAVPATGETSSLLQLHHSLRGGDISGGEFLYESGRSVQVHSDYEIEVQLAPGKTCTVTFDSDTEQDYMRNFGAALKGRYIAYSLEFKVRVELTAKLEIWRQMLQNIDTLIATAREEGGF